MKIDKQITWKRTDPKNLNLKEMKIIVVGGTGGIGRAISHFMVSRGAKVVIVGQTFRDAAIPEIQFIKADLSLMSEAKTLTGKLGVENANIIIFTTGIFAAPIREETSEGIERDMAVSYLSRWVILKEIMAQLGTDLPSSSLKPRVFIMGYPGSGKLGNPDNLNAEKNYKPMSAHLNTVAANEMMVLGLAKQYKNINFYGLNPGLLPTNIRSNYIGEGTIKLRFMDWAVKLLAMSTETYAEGLTPLLVSPDIENNSGTMFNQKGIGIKPSSGFTDSYINQFMTASDELVQKALKNK